MRGNRPDRRLEQAVAESLALAAGETIVVAASGGPDSTALAALTASAAAEAGAHALLAYVNHGQRPGAWQDEAVVVALAGRLGQAVRVLPLALPPRASEARLRSERYAKLAALAVASGATRVAVAHHAEDQTETVLLALFRGTGPAGLTGMAPERDLASGVRIVRPLLRFDRRRLLDYCLRAQLPFALDPTNDDRRFRRNAVRAALAELRTQFPRLDEAVARCAAIAGDEAQASPRARVRSRLRSLLADRAALADVTFERLDAVAQAIERSRPGRHFVARGVDVTIR
ncbi:MAG: tRNA lysidine(34) synthetase TilS [Vulcanimicrobiaceae bacterium]